MRTKLEKVFTAALSSAGTDMKRATEVKLDDAILRCLSTLPASTSEDDLEDLVYFVLDVYGFHGVPVAISEMDTDQVSFVCRYFDRNLLADRYLADCRGSQDSFD